MEAVGRFGKLRTCCSNSRGKVWFLFEEILFVFIFESTTVIALETIHLELDFQLAEFDTQSR